MMIMIPMKKSAKCSLLTESFNKEYKCSFYSVNYVKIYSVYSYILFLYLLTCYSVNYYVYVLFLSKSKMNFSLNCYVLFCFVLFLCFIPVLLYLNFPEVYSIPVYVKYYISFVLCISCISLFFSCFLFLFFKFKMLNDCY